MEITERQERIEKAGRDLARKFDWDGVAILKAAEEALTDANFHHEAEIIHVMIDALEKHDQPGFTLTVSVSPEDDESTSDDDNDTPGWDGYQTSDWDDDRQDRRW